MHVLTNLNNAPRAAYINGITKRDLNQIVLSVRQSLYEIKAYIDNPRIDTMGAAILAIT